MQPSHHKFLHVVLTTLLAIVIHQYWNLLSAKNALFHEELIVDRSTADNSLGDSSVWCWGSNLTDRLCRFKNLCYVPIVDEFLFLHGPESVYVGLPTGRYEPALLDLSSVADHNAQYFNFMDALGDEVRRKYRDDQTTILSGTSVLFRRFHPTNLMHALHDDLLPLHNTLLTLPEKAFDTFSFSQRFKQRLIFADDYGPEPFEDLYNLMSITPPTHKEDLRSMNDLVCFTDSYVGLLKHSTWYQYGFTEPQGPIPGRTVTSRTVRKFCKYVRSQLNISLASEFADGRSIVILSRKYNRLILNEAELILALARNLRMKVVLLSLETHSISEIISTVSSASALIGMHGSLLSLAMFLPRGSVLLELFPYAVNPAHYTPYRTLADLPGMGIHYESWRNLDVENTVAHPKRSPAEGGISHLTAEKQASIKSSPEVPRHLCCSDPEWLFRIYQDTVVDVDAIVRIVSDASSLTSRLLPGAAERVRPTVERELCPSFVRNISCKSGVQHDLPFLLVSWQSPSNLDYLSFSELKYEVWIQEEGTEDYSAWLLTKYEHSFTAGIQPSTNYIIWVRSVIGKILGPFNVNPVMCST